VENAAERKLTMKDHVIFVFLNNISKNKNIKEEKISDKENKIYKK
jgi:hypothetical protein